MVFGIKVGSEDSFELRTATWPDPKPAPLNPRAIGRYRLGSYLDGLQFSADGRKVLFVANRVLPNGKEVEVSDVNDVGTDLWILDVKANTVKPLTTDGLGYRAASWSPDGRYVCAICLEGDIPGHPEGGAPPIDSTFQYLHNLYVWDTHTGKRWQLAEYVDDATWHTDRTIYYTGTNESERAAIYCVDMIERKPRQVVVGRPNLNLRECSPDGRYLAYIYDMPSGEQVLSLLEVDSNKRRILKDVDIGAEWSPDGRKLAWLACSEAGSDSPGMCRPSIHDVSTERTETLGEIRGGDARVEAWSQDGKWLIVVRYTKPYPVYSLQAQAVPVDGGEPVVLLTSPEWTNGFIWHELPADGSRLATREK
jgi:Tol biopolymer transport system component